MAQPRIIVSQPQLQTTNQVVLSAGAQLKTQGGQTVIVQNSQQRPSVVLQQTNTGQLILPQLVSNAGQGGQYILQTTGGQQGTYIVAQSQTAVVHGQPQTVLVAQTPQQQGTGTKTIIILQQQPNAATHHQKVMVTPQGQQVVVTQMPRPIMQQSSVSTNIVPATSVIKATPSAAPANTVQNVVMANSTNATVIKKEVQEEVKPAPAPQKVKIVRDLSSPYVCEWGDCQM